MPGLLFGRYLSGENVSTQLFIQLLAQNLPLSTRMTLRAT